MANRKLLTTAQNKCWCYFCGKPINKGEKYLNIWKSAWKGSVRINICKDCLTKIFVELGVKNKELSRIKKQMILDNLTNEKNNKN